MRIGILALLAALWAGPALADPPPAEADLPNLDCASPASISPVMRHAADVFQGGDEARGRAVIDAIVARCGEQPTTWPPRVLGALMALRAADYDRGLALIEPVPRTGGGWTITHASYARLRLLAGKGDAEAFGRERRALVDFAQASLISRYHGRLQETFTVNGAEVRAIQATVEQEGFLRRWEFLIIPAEPLALPRSIMLTTDRTVDAMGQPALFIDGYDCESHATLGMIPARPEPDYAALRQVVTQALQGHINPVSGMTPGSANLCAWVQFVTPGLDG